MEEDLRERTKLNYGKRKEKKNRMKRNERKKCHVEGVTNSRESQNIEKELK